MTTTIRRPKTTVGANAGLTLARYVAWPKDDEERRVFLNNVAKAPVGQAYESAFARWKEALKARKAICAWATLGGPLAVGLGNESATEMGLTLHRTYGTPIIPGSAIKGACLRAITGSDAAAKALFGSTKNAGYAVFHDAWFAPQPASDMPLQGDTVTVHHPAYYQKQNMFPTDFDDPTPIPFVSVRPGAAFLFAIEVPSDNEAWLKFVEEMLRHALMKIGLGGKTNAGYGWFKDVRVEPRPPSPEEQLAALRQSFTARLAPIRSAQDVSRVDKMLEEIAAHENVSVRAALAGLVRDHLIAIKQWKPDKARGQKILELLKEKP